MSRAQRRAVRSGSGWSGWSALCCSVPRPSWSGSGSATSAVAWGIRSRRRERSTGRLRAIPSWQSDPGAGPPRARLPRRRPAGLGGTARPLHDPGALAAGRDGHRAAGAAGRAQAGDPRPPIADPGRRAGWTRAAAEVVRELNADLEQARIAAGLIPLTGTGIVLQLEDSLEPVAPDANDDRLPRRRPGPAHGRRGAVGRRSGGHRASTASASRPRRASSTSARRSSSTRPISCRRTRSRPSGRDDLYARLAASPGFVDFIRARAETYGIRVRSPSPRRSTSRPSPGP